jgi:hypothetical protein
VARNNYSTAIRLIYLDVRIISMKKKDDASDVARNNYVRQSQGEKRLLYQIMWFYSAPEEWKDKFRHDCLSS